MTETNYMATFRMIGIKLLAYIFCVPSVYVHLTQTKVSQDECRRGKLCALVIILESLVVVLL